jgi:ComF family protein
MLSRSLGKAVLDAVYPRECCACGKGLHDPTESGLCWDCRSEVYPLGPPWCSRCGMVVAGRIDHAFTCVDCTENPPRYDQARSLFHYEGGIREAIHALKYHRDLSVVPDLARLLVAGLHAHIPGDGTWVLVPVPLHPKRFAHRGFNQGVELIRAMSHLEPRVRLWDGLRKIKDTESQTQLTKAKRRSNVRGAFRAVEGPVPESVVVLDDVMTTGATLDACAAALKNTKQVETVHTLTVARG